MKQLYYIFALTAVALMSCGSGSVAMSDRQDIHLRDSVLIAGYDFVRPSMDTVADPTGSLACFYDALKQIAHSRPDSTPCVVSVLHYGDSHIQGGVLGETLMRHYAQVYGTAGRGFITPYKLAGKNEPRDYAITSSEVNRSQVLIDRSDELSRGVSGVSVAANVGAQYKLSVMSLPEDDVDYRFSRVMIFHDSLAPIFSTLDPRAMDENGGDDIFRSYTTAINLVKATDTLTLITKSEPPFTSGPIYGFSLENDRSGVIYHTIGVNGACYLHWGRYADVARQSEAFDPRLIIISLGSNEASGSNFIESVFLEEVDSFVSRLRAINPTSAVLLVSPAEAMRRVKGSRTRRPNLNFEKVSLALAKYAAEHGVAFFDLYRATGGATSSAQWQAKGMLARDGLHYTPEGYRLQGALIFTALERGARQWK